MTLIFWISLGVLLYAYLGYGLVAWLGARWSDRQKEVADPVPADPDEWPAVTLLVAAYNESACIEQKIRNSLELDYPADRLELLFVTDGSTDQTNEIIRQYPQVKLLFEPERKGKIAAVARAMSAVGTELTVLTDANTMLNREAIRNIVRPFRNPRVGAVAGEKRVLDGQEAHAAGESLYWRYESKLKEWDARWYSVVGAAGELYAIRTALFQDVPGDTILDDFMQTLLIAKQGFRVAYAGDAFALEGPSADTREEFKRKVRICAGGFQAIQRLGNLANPLRYGILSVQYLSHRVLRWTLAPVALLLVLVANSWLAGQGVLLYDLMLVGQGLFYLMALLGYLRQDRTPLFPGFFVPFYFLVMNLAAFVGFQRYLRKGQSVNWQRARRAEMPSM